ncbi:MAG: hypothetical protein ACLGIB_03850 [Actinomycetota bacterium]
MDRTFPPLVLAVCLLLGACSGSDESRAEACPAPTPLDSLSLLPRDIPLDEWGVVETLEVTKGFLRGRAVSDTQIVELYPVMARATVAAGYEILSGDNEGFEAEIFFVRGEDTTGTYVLREGPCGDQVTIRLLYGSKRYREAS